MTLLKNQNYTILYRYLHILYVTQGHLVHNMAFYFTNMYNTVLFNYSADSYVNYYHTRVSLGVILRSKTIGHLVCIFPAFEDIAKLWYLRVHIFQRPHQHLIVSNLPTCVNLLGVKWNLWGCLICISLISDEVKPLFLCLFTISVSPFAFLVLFLSCPHFSVGWFVFFHIDLWEFFIYLDINPMSVTYDANVFP